MPLFLIPLALSLFSAGVGIFTQQAANNQLAQDAEKALAEQESKNATDRIEQHVSYITAIDSLNNDKKTLAEQAKKDAAQTQQTITIALFTTSILLIILTIITFIKTSPTKNQKIQ